MQDMHKTKEQLVEELEQLRNTIARLEAERPAPPFPDRQLLAALTDQMLEPTVMLDWEGTLVHGNALAAKVIGVEDAAELAGMSMASILHPDSLGQAVADLELVRESEADFAASYKLLIDGRTVHIDSHGTKIELSDGSVDLVSFRDVTRRREQENRDRANELILRSVLDHSSTVIYIKEPDGRYLLVNKRYEELFGVTLEEIAGKTDLDIFPVDAARRFQAMDHRAVEAGRSIEEEELVPHADGLHTYLSVKFPLYDVGGKVFATCGISTDITERKQAELALASHHDELERHVEERTRELTEVNRRLKAEVAERKRAEEQAAIFRRFAEASGQGFGMADLEGQITYLNPAFCRITGLDRAEKGYGRHITEFHPSEMRERLTQEVVPTVMHKGEWVGEMPLLHDSGEPVPVILNMFLIRDETDEPYQFAAVLTDISERKQAEEALAESEAKYRALFENSVVGQFRVAVGGKMLAANRTMARMFGWDDLATFVDECEMAHLWFDPADRARMYEIMKEHGELDNFETQFHRKDGTIFPVRVSSKMYPEFGYQEGIVIDVSEEKAALEALVESEKRFRVLAESTSAQIIITQMDRFFYANKAALDHFQMTWEELSSHRPYELLMREVKDAGRAAFEAARVSGDQKLRFEFSESSTEGGLRWYEVNGSQLEVDGEPAWIWTSFDITELKRAQHEMYRADKMAALGQIIAGVAHEINNPNNFIYFNLPILRKYIEAVTPLLELRLQEKPDLKILNMPYEDFIKDVFNLLENMEHGSMRITSIVSDLKAYVRSDEDQDRKTAQIGQAIERVMTLVGKQVRKMVKRFDVEVADGLPPVQMNVGKIEQVLINLLINAGQAADKELSWVKLSARPATSVEGWVEILVEDNGAGIPEDSLEQIFEPFFTSKGRDQGTGLGLSISHRIIEEHGGKISVESTLGEGTCFTVLLPGEKGRPD